MSLTFTTCTDAIHIRKKCGLSNEHKLSRQPKYHLQVTHHPLFTMVTTVWRQLLSCGSPSDFSASRNVDKDSYFRGSTSLVCTRGSTTQLWKFVPNKTYSKEKRSMFSTTDIVILQFWCTAHCQAARYKNWYPYLVLILHYCPFALITSFSSCSRFAIKMNPMIYVSNGLLTLKAGNHQTLPKNNIPKGRLIENILAFMTANGFHMRRKVMKIQETRIARDAQQLLRLLA